MLGVRRMNDPSAVTSSIAVTWFAPMPCLRPSQREAAAEGVADDADVG